MNKIEIPKVDLTIHFEKLTNGLEVYIVPKRDVSNTYVTFTTRFGSMHSSYVKDDETIQIPDGTAHFLEHKVFEQYNGVSTFEFFSERGAEGNASTSKYRTSYYFSGSHFVEECIEFLLDSVQENILTDKSVEKEKGIIAQEIKMYEDAPYQQLNDLFLYNSFVKHPIRYPIGGTIESINTITKDILDNCYKTFYQPNNMYVIVVGDVDPDKILELIMKNQEKKNFSNEKIKLLPIDEPDKVFEKKVVKPMNVIIPKVAISFKINILKFDNFYPSDIAKYLSIYFENKFGYISEFNETMREKELISSAIEISSDYTDKHVLISLMMDSKYSDVVIKSILEEIKNKDPKEEDLERAKKVLKSAYIYMSDSIYGINNSIMDQVIRYGKLISDDITLVDRYNFKDYQYIINNISLKNYNITILTPNK